MKLQQCIQRVRREYDTTIQTHARNEAKKRLDMEAKYGDKLNDQYSLNAKLKQQLMQLENSRETSTQINVLKHTQQLETIQKEHADQINKLKQEHKMETNRYSDAIQALQQKVCKLEISILSHEQTNERNAKLIQEYINKNNELEVKNKTLLGRMDKLSVQPKEINTQPQTNCKTCVELGENVNRLKQDIQTLERSANNWKCKYNELLKLKKQGKN